MFFGMDEATYHAIPRLSASGIKNLLVSPMDFWARSWMNPRRPEEEDDKEWKVYGRAYHKRILEGRDAFYAAYAPFLDEADYPNALTKQEHYKQACREMGLPVGGKNDELIERLLAAGCDKQLMPVIVAEHAKANAGKTFLKPDWFFQIELSAACIEFDESLAVRFQKGFPEVAILWTDEVTSKDGEILSVPMKCKVDYLKTREINDLKTFSNQMQRPFDRATFQEIASRKYHIQVATYYRGVEAAEEMVDRGMVNVLSGPAPKHAWLDAFAKHPKTFSFIFQQKGVAPVAGGYTMDDSRIVLTMGNARDQIREAQIEFVACMDHFGTDPWIRSRGMRIAEDTDFPGYMVQ